jgi:hypothetical protein
MKNQIYKLFLVCNNIIIKLILNQEINIYAININNNLKIKMNNINL